MREEREERRRGGAGAKVTVALLSALAAAPIATSTAAEPVAPTSAHLATKKEESPRAEAETPLLATLVQTHTDERIPLDGASPPDARFDLLLADRVTGAAHALDPRLLGLLRTLAARHAGDAGAPRIELVSGFRSPKLNETMRKKGHHVASHSQHSLGNAVDFRIVVARPDVAAGESRLDPRDLEREIRALGWDGGVGVYTSPEDGFVHADVGPRRRWSG